MKTNLLTVLLFVTCQSQLVAQKGDQWTDKVYSIDGNWAIEEESGSVYFKLGSDFMTLAGPELKLYLSPIAINEISDREAIDKKGGLMIAELKSNKGAQKYPLPQDVVLSDYRSIVIFCPKFSVVWGGASLEADN